MKKILSILVVATLLLSTCLSVPFVTKANEVDEATETVTQVDLTQEPLVYNTQTDNITGYDMTVTRDADTNSVTIESSNSQPLTKVGIESCNSAYYFKDSNGNLIKFAQNDIVTVSFDFVLLSGSLIIGIGMDESATPRSEAFVQYKGTYSTPNVDRSVTRTFATNLYEDQWKVVPKLIFSGTGKVKITNITVKKSSYMTYNADLSKTHQIGSTSTNYPYTITPNSEGYFTASGNQAAQKISVDEYNISQAGLKNADGIDLTLPNDCRIAIIMKYTLVDLGTGTTDPQIGIGYNNSSGTYTGLNGYKSMAYKTHTSSDAGKEFTLSAVQDCTNLETTGTYNKALRIGFSGEGNFKITSIKIELIAKTNTNYATVNYVNNGAKTIHLQRKNSPAEILTNFGYEFSGWYDSVDYSGEPVQIITVDTTLYAKWTATFKKYDCDLTKMSTTNTYAPTDDASKVSFSMNTAGNLEAKIYGYTYQMSASMGNTTKAWYPAIRLQNSAGNLNTAAYGDKAIVQIEYTVKTCNASDNWGMQIGVATSYGDKVAYGVKNYKKHTKADEGKTFTMAAVWTVNDKKINWVVFSGQGTFEIKSVTFTHLPVAVTGYNAVTYNNGNNSTAEFLKVGEPLSTPDDATENGFLGWFDANENQVSSITADTVVTAKYSKVVTSNLDLSKFIDVTKDLDKQSQNYPYTFTYEDGVVKATGAQFAHNLTGAWGSQVSLLGFKNADDSEVVLKSGYKYAVNVEYKIVSNYQNSNGATNITPQIAITTANGATTFMHQSTICNVKTHAVADVGNTYKFSATVTGNDKALRLGFSGVAIIDIKNVTLKRVSASESSVIAVNYVDGDSNEIDFIDKSAALKDNHKIGYAFDGWYDSTEDTANRIETLEADGTVYAKWSLFIRGDVTGDKEINLADIIRIKKVNKGLATGNDNFDLDGDTTVAGNGDITFLRKLLAGIIFDTSDIQFKVVYSADADIEGVTLAKELKVYLEKATDREVAIYSDATEADTYEVLVGNTNRQVSPDAIGTLKDNADFAVNISDNTIVIAGKTNVALENSIEYFKTEFCKNDVAAIPTKLAYNDDAARETLTIADADLANLSVLVNNPSIMTMKAAKALVKKIANITGTVIAINPETATAKNIAINVTDIASGDYTTAVTDGNVVITAKSDYAANLAVEDLIANIKNIGPNYSASDTYTAGTFSLGGYALKWSDEFNDGTLDWVHTVDELKFDGVGTANRVASAATETGGELVQTTKNNLVNYTGSRVSTLGKMSFKYGVVEANMKLGLKTGAASGFWLRGIDVPSKEPVGEIDIFENLCRPKVAYYNLHSWYGDDSHVDYGASKAIPDRNDLVFADPDAYYNIGIEWTEDFIYIYVDGVLYNAIDITDIANDGFNREMYVLFDCCIASYDGYKPSGLGYKATQKVNFCRIYQIDDAAYTMEK